MKRVILAFSILFILADCSQQNQESVVLAQKINKEVKIEKNPQKEISFENVSFKYDEKLISEIQNAVLPALLLENKDDKPDSVQSRSINFRLAFSNSKKDVAEISVYKVSEYKDAFAIAPQYVQSTTKEFVNLRNILNKSAKLKPFGFEQLPYVPFLDAHLAFYSKAKIVNFQNGKGLLFLTQIGQDAVSIINNEDLFYLFQGLTADNQYFVFATFPLSLEGLPQSVETSDEDSKYSDYEKNQKEYQNYIIRTAQKLNNISNDKFTPNLSKIEDIISSIKVQ